MLKIFLSLLMTSLMACQSHTVLLLEPERLDGAHQIVRLAPPHYATELQDAGIEGWVMLDYSLDARGKVKDVQVVAEQPQGIFANAAIKALKKSLFKPAVVNGQPVPSEHIQIKISFKLPQNKQPDSISCSTVRSEFGNTRCTKVSG